MQKPPLRLILTPCLVVAIRRNRLLAEFVQPTRLQGDQGGHRHRRRQLLGLLGGVGRLHRRGAAGVRRWHAQGRRPSWKGGFQRQMNFTLPDRVYFSLTLLSACARQNELWTVIRLRFGSSVCDDDDVSRSLVCPAKSSERERKKDIYKISH